MKLIAIMTLLSLNVFAYAAEDSDYLCTAKLSRTQTLTVKYDTWTDNRQNARADVTFDFPLIGPRTFVDLYVSGGDSETGGGDFNVAAADWSLEFYVFNRGTANEEVTASYLVGDKKALPLTCKEI